MDKLFKSFSLGSTASTIEDDLQKAKGEQKAGHKYFKRTGAPGNYKYWYKLPNGHVVSSDSEEGAPHVDHSKKHEEDSSDGKRGKDLLIEEKTNKDLANSDWEEDKDSEKKPADSNSDSGKKEVDGFKLKDQKGNDLAGQEGSHKYEHHMKEWERASNESKDHHTKAVDLMSQGKKDEANQLFDLSAQRSRDADYHRKQAVEERTKEDVADDDYQPNDVIEELNDYDDQKFQTTLGDLVAQRIADNSDPQDYGIDSEDFRLSDEEYDQFIEAIKDSDEYVNDFDELIGELASDIHEQIMDGKYDGEKYFDEEDGGKSAKQLNSMMKKFIGSKIKERSSDKESKKVKKSMESDMNKSNGEGFSKLHKEEDERMSKSFHLGPTVHEHDTEIEFGKSLDANVQDYFDKRDEQLKKSTAMETISQPKEQKIDELLKSAEGSKLNGLTKSDVATAIGLEWQFRDKLDTMF